MKGIFGDDTLDGGAGADHLFGGAGHDELYGGDDLDRDFLNGGSGSDVLTAGANDHLNGGAGADVFVIPIKADAVVDDYDATQDQLEVLYVVDTAPTLYLENNSEGLSLIAGDETVATFSHGTPIDLSQIKLIAA
ncbi:hypothetical protein [Cognatiyoonia sediminum]|uniref:hypothetical protein n=1 Tax=Cognatiyoonia sediminum TaxID=1508389 RepID=UPI0009FB8DF4|nr:hypothetical protein [Cognatiyoonia sediminum]